MTLTHFLKMRVFKSFCQNTLSLMQNAYMNKFVKNNNINIIIKRLFVSIFENLEKFMKEIDSVRIHEYKKKFELICYSVVIIRLDIIKTIFKLSKFLINLGSNHLIAAN